MDYNNGKIYKIVCNKTGLIYVGSTCQPLYKRIYKHKDNFNQYKNGNDKRYYTSYKIIENGDYDIVLVENYPCLSKDELHRKEREYIEKLDCVNKVIPTRTQNEYQNNKKEELDEYRKKYYEENKELIKLKVKKWRELNIEKATETKHQYYESNKTEILTKQKEHYYKNKDIFAIKNKTYREENKEKISERKKIYTEKNNYKITCGCGSVFCKIDKSKHDKTKKHIAYLNTSKD